MKKVVFSFHMPKKNEYMGGVASIVNSYLEKRQSFENHDYSVLLADYDDRSIAWIPVSPFRTMCYGVLQYHNLKIQNNREKIDIFHIHTSRRFLFLKDVFLGCALAKFSGVKVFMTIHVGDIKTVMKYLPTCIQKLSIRLLNKHFSKVIFLSNTIKDQFIAQGVRPEKCEVLYNFHNLGKQAESTKCKNEHTRFLFMGMINRDKGILDLLDAAHICDNENFSLDIGGMVTDDSIRQEYRTKLDALGDKVTEWGYITGQEKNGLFNASDVLVLPSYHEGFPLVVLEALSAGCALIVTPVGAMPEILDETNTIWVEPGDVAGLAKAIEQFCSEKEMLAAMQKTNRELGKSYSLEAHIMNLCKIYSSGNAADSVK